MWNTNQTIPANSTEVHSATLGLVLGSLSLITIIMNILVLYAVKTERKLHTVGNLYIVSLSVADFIVGAAVMPLNIAYLLSNEWILGRPVCLFWLSMDYVASTASIFSLFILCLDRYRSVQQPLQYLKYRTKTRASVMISGAWLLSSMWIIPILGWHVFANGGIREVPERTCETEFHKVTWFKVLTATVNFYIPSLLMLWFYSKIYKAVREHYQHRELNGSFQSFNNRIMRNEKLQKICLKTQDKDGNPEISAAHFLDPCSAIQHGTYTQTKGMEKSLQLNDFQQTPQVQGYDREVVKLRCFPLTIVQAQPCVGKVRRNYVDVRHGNIKEQEPFSQNQELTDTSDEHTFAEIGSCKVNSDQAANEKSGARGSASLSYLRYTWDRLRTHSKQNMQGLHLNRERKAAKQLGFIMAAFMLCWIPYFVFFMVIAFCQDCCNHNFHMFTIWLGYVNSTLNPLIYPLCNENFKKTFKKIFHIHS
ncbi:histamine H1 receptor [Rhinatrema bivittatum]|uniref:histamine H1 receptor n=1 Tax=Rhinatrema bivittatum TaxID=194408 RepID=UPI00112C09ED|nr:histamine H1 receptor [Rhinatrema bivittatum]